MTEEEAKNKPCIGPPNCGTRSPSRWCVASECLAWRVSYQTYPPVNGYVYGIPQGAERKVYSENDGYCALAGKP